MLARRGGLKARWGLLLLAAVVGFGDVARAEEPSGPIVKVRFDAAPSESLEALQDLSGLRVGQMYRPLAVRRAVRRLYQLGRFENVIVRASTTQRGVSLKIDLPPRQVLQSFEVDAGDVLDEDDILTAIKARVGGRFDARVLPKWEEALERVLLRRGYRDPAIGFGYRILNKEGRVQVQIRVAEGPVTRLRRVLLTGRTRQPVWRLEKVIGLSPGDIVDLDDIDERIEAVRAFYRSEGYLDVVVERADVRSRRSPSTRRPEADVILRIEAGPKVRVRFQGNRAVVTRSLKEDAELLQELGTGPAAMAEVRERIVGRYERRGYWRAQVAPAVRMTPNGEKKEVLFSIREGPRALVRNLTFPGNVLFDEERLTGVVVEAVRDALGDEDGRPGANAEVVSAIIGAVPPADGRRPAYPQPDTSAPDPRQVYIPRSYRAAQEELADLYRAEGYQTVAVADPVVTPVVGQEAIDVAFPVDEGVRWQIAVLSFVGNDQVASTDLAELAGFELDREGGQALSFDDVENARRAIQKRYRDLGFLYVQVADELRKTAMSGLELGTVRTATAAFAEVRQSCAQAQEEGKKACDVELVFRISEGIRVRTRDVIVKGVESTWDSIVQNEIVVKAGEVLSERAMEETRDNLLRLGLFDLVDVRPLEENEIRDFKDVLVEVKERGRYWFELGIGASTEDGLRGSAAFGDGNLFGSALRFQMQAGVNIWLPPLLVLYNREIRDQIRPFYNRFGTFGRLEYEVAAGLSYPRIPGLPRGFSAGLDMIVLRDFDPAFLENTQTLTLLATYKDGSSSLRWPRQPSFQLRANIQRTDLECNQNLQRELGPNQIPGDDDPARFCSGDIESMEPAPIRGTNAYLSAGPRVIWDLRDDSLNPTTGAYFEVESFYGLGLDSASPDYVSVSGRMNVYLPLRPQVGFALSLIGERLFQIGDRNEEIPVNRRLFAGGRTTIRGYAERTLLPQDVELDEMTGDPTATISTGGQLLVALKTELRVSLFPSLALSMFYDVGDLWQDGIFRLETRERLMNGALIRRSLAQGAGVGLRVSTPIGPLAIDLAVPVNRRDPGPSSPQLHFAVGSF